MDFKNGNIIVNFKRSLYENIYQIQNGKQTNISFKHELQQQDFNGLAIQHQYDEGLVKIILQEKIMLNTHFYTLIESFNEKSELQQRFLDGCISNNDSELNKHFISQIVINPLYLQYSIKIALLEEFPDAHLTFIFSRVIFNNIFDLEDKHLKFRVVDGPSKLLELFKMSPLNYGYFCCQSQIRNIPTILHNTYIPIQVFQNILCDTECHNILKFDSKFSNQIRSIMSFLPTLQFGIITFSLKQDRYPLLYLNNNTFQAQHIHLCLNIETSVIDEGYYTITLKLNDSYPQFIQSTTNFMPIIHQKFCQKLDIPQFHLTFINLINLLLYPRKQQPVEDDTIVQYKLNSLSQIELFFRGLFIYAFIFLIKETYLQICQQYHHEQRLSYQMLDKLFKADDGINFFQHDQVALQELIRRPLITIYQILSKYPKDKIISPQTVAGVIHNLLCIGYFSYEMFRKFGDKQKYILSKIIYVLIQIEIEHYEYSQHHTPEQFQRTIVWTRVEEGDSKLSFQNNSVLHVIQINQTVEVHLYESKMLKFNRQIDRILDQDLEDLKKLLTQQWVR